MKVSKCWYLFASRWKAKHAFQRLLLCLLGSLDAAPCHNKFHILSGCTPSKAGQKKLSIQAQFNAKDGQQTIPPSPSWLMTDASKCSRFDSLVAGASLLEEAHAFPRQSASSSSSVANTDVICKAHCEWRFSNIVFGPRCNVESPYKQWASEQSQRPNNKVSNQRILPNPWNPWTFYKTSFLPSRCSRPIRWVIPTVKKAISQQEALFGQQC